MVLGTRQLSKYKIQTLELSAVFNSYFLTVHITLLAFKHPWTTLRQTWKIFIKQLIKHTTPLKYYQNTGIFLDKDFCEHIELWLLCCQDLLGLGPRPRRLSPSVLKGWAVCLAL